MIDGEAVAFDEEGGPSFNALQNYGTAPAPVVYYVFDVLVLRGVDVRRKTLEERLAVLETKVLPKLAEPVRGTVALEARVPVLVASGKAQGSRGSWRSVATVATNPGCAQALDGNRSAKSLSTVVPPLDGGAVDEQGRWRGSPEPGGDTAEPPSASDLQDY